jgi:hypothetical protein
MAALIGKLIILLIPILGVLYPMTRLLPRLYDWAMRSKLLRMYGELRLLEDDRTSPDAARCIDFSDDGLLALTSDQDGSCLRRSSGCLDRCGCFLGGSPFPNNFQRRRRPAANHDQGTRRRCWL